MLGSKKQADTTRSNKWIFGTMLVFGIIGLITSFLLANDEILLLKHPGAALNCSINLVLNCSTVMQTWQAHVFGFPNMLIGLMAFPIVITVATIELAGVSLPRWFWRAATICYAGGALFAYWLFFNSLYVIQVLCPLCLIITLTTTILLGTITHYSFRENVFNFSKTAHKKILAFLAHDYHKLIVATWLVLLAVLIVLKFGSGLFA